MKSYIFVAAGTAVAAAALLSNFLHGWRSSTCPAGRPPWWCRSLRLLQIFNVLDYKFQQHEIERLLSPSVIALANMESNTGEAVRSTNPPDCYCPSKGRSASSNALNRKWCRRSCAFVARRIPSSTVASIALIRYRYEERAPTVRTSVMRVVTRASPRKVAILLFPSSKH